jgi:hypothetical protein
LMDTYDLRIRPWFFMYMMYISPSQLSHWSMQQEYYGTIEAFPLYLSASLRFGPSSYLRVYTSWDITITSCFCPANFQHLVNSWMSNPWPSNRPSASFLHICW